MSTEKPMENNTYTHCKRSFKAVEGFLRRVAFNLGNTPSQTEVKIISCIPIDVTDLQLKIFELQKELEESKSHAHKEVPQNVNTSLIQSSVLPYKDICPSCNAKQCVQSNARLNCNDGFGHNSSLSFYDQGSTSKNQRSTISFVHPNASSLIGPFSSEVVTNKTEREKKPRNFFSKRKAASKSKRKKQKTHVIYYAQTDTKTPFCNPSHHSLSNAMTAKNYGNDASGSVPFALSHFSNAVVRRQYKPQSVLNNTSNLSEFSTPVCRDTPPSDSLYSCYDTDACSCFHDQFQNIDHLMNNQVKFNLYPTYENYQNYSRNAYYDSNFYDMVPVREKPLKIRNDIEIQKKKLHKKITVKKYHPVERLKYRTQPTVVNYCTTPLIRHDDKRRLVRSQNRRDYVLNQMGEKRVPGDLFNTRSVDFGPVYAKQVLHDKQRFIPTRDNKRDFNFYPTVKNNTEMPLAPADNLTFPESKTETTLNQIKSMLQSVLNEVKISSKLSKPMPKKDAVVQNGPSQGTLNGESQLMQSFTYSPYNLNPYMACCSRQVASNNCTCPGAPDHYVQQFPLLIEPQKHICSNCYRNTPVAKRVNTYNATSAATNTEQKERSKETDQLIKEIYKSIALNVEMPSSKDTTAGGYSTRKSNVKAATNYVTIEKNKASNIVNSVSEIFKNTNTKGSTYTGNTDATAASKTTSNISGTESEHDIKLSRGAKAERKCSYSRNVTSTTETIDGEPERMSQSVDQSGDTEESSSQTESDDVALEVKKSGKSIDTKKEKNGIFNKMFKIFKPKQRCRKKADIDDAENESESDSDDYQTVYSHKVEAPRGIHIRNRPHSKSFYVNQAQQRARSPENSRIHTKSSPYMDQEHRKYWDETVMLKKTQRNSTEISRKTDAPKLRRPLYPQNYEARSALVERIRQVPLRMPGNVHLFQSVPCNRYNPRNMNNGGVRPNYTENVSYCQENSQYRTGNRPHYPGNRNSPERGQKYRENSLNFKNKNIANYPANKGLQPHYVTSKSSGQRKTVKSAIGAAWLKRHKLGIKCTGQQWRNIVNA